MTLPLYKKALYLEYITVGYNILEGAASIIAGWFAGSIALVGFGLDSGVESLSGAVLIWRFARHGKISISEEERVEKRATRLIGASFFVLGGYVLFESLKKLIFQEAPSPSLFGIVIAFISLISMPVLSYAKFKTARGMKSRSLEADSMESLVCSLLSLALLTGLLLNYVYGLWWADPASAIVIVAFIFWTGFETLSEGREGEG